VNSLLLALIFINLTVVFGYCDISPFFSVIIMASKLSPGF